MRARASLRASETGPVGKAAADVARMLALVPWLLERPGVTVDETADTFGVEPPVIRRDLQHLDFCGLPGLAGGDLFEVDLVGDRIVVSMADELRRPLRPTPAEALRLVLTVDGVAEVLADDLPALRSAVDKVRTALGLPAQVADVLPDEPLDVLGGLRDALRETRRVTFDYHGRADTAPRQRTVEPWQLLVVDGLWYLQGFDIEASGARSFRIDRLHGLTVTEVACGQPLPDQMPSPEYQPSERAVEVTLALEPSARWITEAVRVDDIGTGDDGRIIATLSTDAPLWIAQLVVGAGGGARVLEPGWLRDHVRDAATRGLAGHR